MTKTNSIRFLFLAGAIFVVPMTIGTNAGCARATKAKPAIVLTDAEKQAAQGFEARVADHAVLHQKLDATLPSLPDKATPEQIEQHREALGALMKTARKDAKQGDFFTPDMEALARRALGATLAGPDGTSLQAAIMEDNPGLQHVNVNDRYPIDAPVSTMPMQFLEILPKLPDGLEYRFLGKHLVLVCSPAQMILDLTPNVMP